MHLIPTARNDDSSIISGGWYRAPGCPGKATAAARRTKTHADGPTPSDRSVVRAVGMTPTLAGNLASVGSPVRIQMADIA